MPELTSTSVALTGVLITFPEPSINIVETHPRHMPYGSPSSRSASSSGVA
ncbi:MAG: hypothetical protein IH874_04105 [Candidatus Dadabacteria bacterium]|nr:hypothetical protein [Candidatus Dadabacteria bacterium]